MRTRVDAIIVDPHRFLREGIHTLLLAHSYNVIQSVNSLQDIQLLNAGAEESQKLVLLGTGLISVTALAQDIEKVRAHWPECKIVFLFGANALNDIYALPSLVDACISARVSGDCFIRTLDLVMFEGAQIVMLSGHEKPAVDQFSGKHNERKITKEWNASKLNHVGILGANGSGILDANGSGESPGAADSEPAATTPELVHLSSTPRYHSEHKLTERELQIVGGLVKGHANKTIARAHKITEATVKVHLKAILRKIQVANRTQAAVWALEHGLGNGADPRVLEKNGSDSLGA